MSTVAALLNRSLTVWRTSAQPDGSGGQTVVLVQLPDPVAAKVDQPTAAERMVGAQAGSEHTHNVYLLPAADVRRGDELRDPATGERWRVLAVVAPSTPVYRKAESHLIQPEGEPD